MKPLPKGLRLSASDLSNHLACAHLTTLDRGVALGRIAATTYWDPRSEALRERGEAHERAYLDSLRAEGRPVFVANEDPDFAAAAGASEAAMRRGEQVIAQATLLDGDWLGRADLLMRVERPSDLGSWSYEVADTKLAVETRGGTVLQLCLYSDLLQRLQGLWPEHMHVVAPGEPFAIDRLRTDDYLAYYRLVKRRLEGTVATPFDESATYPEPVAHCDVCRWWAECEQRRRRDDHLSLVAGMQRGQQRELAAREIGTVARLASEPLPLTWRPERGAAASYVRLREQARIQVESRPLPLPRFELLPREAERGLARLPEPSAGDVFLDLEGDPFVAGGGREYLFGLVILNERGQSDYVAHWSLDAAAEKAGFEWLVDTVMARWANHPGTHIYHFAPYEPSALKRLASRYGTREDELDRFLRGGLFVDLYAIVRQALRAGVESYSIKRLEALYGFSRALPLREASESLRIVEVALEVGDPAAIDGAVRDRVQAYNRDDCLSAMHLRNWLEAQRQSLVDSGEEIARPIPQDAQPSEALGERRAQIAAVAERLLDGLPVDRAERSADQQGRWLLAHLLDWHRREAKVAWWEYFHLCELDDEARLEEPAALAGLEFVETVGGTAQCPHHRYRYPAQETQCRAGDNVHIGISRPLGSIEAHDPAARTIDVRKRKDTRDLHPTSLFAHQVIGTAVLEDALLRVGAWVADHGIEPDGMFRSGRDLLIGRHPRVAIRPGSPLRAEGEGVVAAAKRLVLVLDNGVMPIQGPPGTGKTYTAARLIVGLVAAGKRVGVTALSHKVIRNLLDEVARAAREEAVALQCIQKAKPGDGPQDPLIVELDDNALVRDALLSGQAQVAGGTAWLWAREDMARIVDVLVVDEAGQMSLANAVAVSQAAESLILVGDPRQLEQPLQGCHPEGCEVSALDHLQGGDLTVRPERGLFLDETWRLHPNVCTFTSEQFYQGRLQALPGLDRQRLRAPAPFDGSGLFYLPVSHDGNQNASAEEARVVAELVRSWLRAGATWIDRHAMSAPLRLDDILIVTPYNAQVALLRDHLPGARVGTVDKFQGQEAPVAIYSMASSSPEDAPRGMEFLYNRSRLNVATSRARCAAVLVASPRLFEPDCRTPAQMRLANAMCRFLELAQTISAAELGDSR